MCLNFLIVKIGCDNENKIKVDTSVTVDVLNTASQTAITTGNNQIATINQIFVNNGVTGRIICDFTVSQQNVNSTVINNTFTTQQVSNIQTDIVNQVQDKLTQEQTQGILAFLDSIGQAGSVTNSQDITNKVKESVTNAVRQVDIMKIWNSDISSNAITITNLGLIQGADCNIIQSNLLNVRITNITNAIQENLQNDTFLNNLLTYSNQTIKTGTFSLKWIIIAIIIIVALIIIGVVLYFIFGGKSTPPQAAGQSKEQEKMMLERELMEKKEGIIRKPGDISVKTPGRADETAKELFERHDAATSPSILDRFSSLANKYGSKFANYAEEMPIE